MFSGPKKPFTAVSVQVDRMTSEQFEEDDLSGIIDLIEVIKIQSTGPTEAARALRKKLKYGSTHNQIRALTLLDGLIENAGKRFQKTFADEPLLERLRIIARDEVVDESVRQKCNFLFRQWAIQYKDTPGLSGIAQLHKTLPQRKTRPPRQTKSIRETEVPPQDEAEPTPAAPASTPPRGHSRNTSSAGISGGLVQFATSPSTRSPITLDSAPSLYAPSKKSKKDKRSKSGGASSGPPFDLKREKPQIMQTIASSSVASTNLLNALRLINRENEHVATNPEVAKRFETCKALRRQILRYIQLVEGDELIGSLLEANDALVRALTAYDLMDRDAEDDDSDSDAWEDAGGITASAGKAPVERAERQLAGLNIGGANAAAPVKSARPPPRQESESEEESEEDEDEDEENPFGDSHKVRTPAVERQGMNWR